MLSDWGRKNEREAELIFLCPRKPYMHHFCIGLVVLRRSWTNVDAKGD